MGTRVIPNAGGGYISGQATVRIKGKTAAIVIYDKAGEQRGQLEVEAKSLPKQITSGKWMVKTGAKLDRVFSIWPINGDFLVRVRRFSGKPGTAPVPFTWQNPRHPEWKTQMYCNPVIEIMEGPLAGLQCSIRVPYKWCNDKGIAAVSGKGKETEFLVNFLGYAGYDFQTDEIPYAENILTDLEQILVRRKKDFFVKFENGYVASMAPQLGKPAKAPKKARKIR